MTITRPTPMDGDDAARRRNASPSPDWHALVASKRLEQLHTMESAVQAQIKALQQRKTMEERLQNMETLLSDMKQKIDGLCSKEKTQPQSGRESDSDHLNQRYRPNIEHTNPSAMESTATTLTPLDAETPTAPPPIFEGFYRCAKCFWEVQICDDSFETVERCGQCGHEYSRPSNYIPGPDEDYDSDAKTSHLGPVSEDEESQGSLANFIDNMEYESSQESVVASSELGVDDSDDENDHEDAELVDETNEEKVVDKEELEQLLQSAITVAQSIKHNQL